ncbi:MAG: hypothetical protein K8S99_11380 [Planctomycetes bacterium]|nr:hypothetical protein [Planctomycetota bacterium]
MPVSTLKSCLLAGLATLSLSAPLFAGVEIVTAHRLPQGQGPRVYVVTRDIVEPAAIVTRELSEQPVRPDLIEVRMVNTTVLLDPDADYYHQGVNPVDQNFSLLKAQRLARSLRGYARGVTVIYGGPVRETIDVNSIKPRMIMMKPTPGNGPQQPGDMPIVPQPPEKSKDSKTVAMAE